MSTRKSAAAQQGMLPFDEPATCRHLARRTVRATHEPCAEGRACNHAIVCTACGAIVGTESWSLVSASGARMHGEAYP